MLGPQFFNNNLTVAQPSTIYIMALNEGAKGKVAKFVDDSRLRWDVNLKKT